ncbi:MAG: APC family permease, partial [Oscillibacter sp.]|nr:APC family permease [Oscillibacter sp.]
MKAGKERRAETPLSVWALAFSCCIGWGCFIMPGTTFLPAAGPVGTAIAMAVGGALMILIAGSYHYMINLFPDNGGAFTYAKNTFGYDQGFLCGWYLWLAYISLIWANATAFILIIRQLPGNFLAFGFHYQAAGFDVYFGEVLAAGGILVLFGVLSMYAGRLERILHTVLAVLLFASAAACFLMALARSGTADPVPPFSATTSPGVGILSIAALALWVFMGFETVSHVAGEYRFAHKRVFGIMASAVASAGLCYALMTFVAAMRQPDGFSDWQGYIAALGSRTGLEAIPVFFVMDSALGKAGLAL